MSNDGFTVLVRGDGRRHWMSMCTGWPSHSKWLSELEQWICIKFCVKLEHSSTETIQMIQKATAMGNWWLAVHHDNAPARAEFFGKTSITLMTQPPYSPDLVSYNYFLGQPRQLSYSFPQIWWSSWWRLGELCEVPRYLLWRELGHHCPVNNVSCIFFSKYLYFSYCMARYFLGRPHIYAQPKEIIYASWPLY